MIVEEFKKLLNSNNAIRITYNLIIFADYELYNFTSKKGKKYHNLDDLLDDNPDLLELIHNTDDFYKEFDGGRGASAGNKKAFGHAGGGKDNSKILLNAELNLEVAKGNSIDAVLKRFRDKYGKADHEYGISVDANGYVHKHVEGNKHSVSIGGGKGETIIHNHPSGSHFSDTDLISIASGKEKSIIATSSNAKIKGTYTFTKGNHFNSKGFIKAVKNAQVSSNLTYNQGVHKWLKDNAKKYGYTYTKSKDANLKGM